MGRVKIDIGKQTLIDAIAAVENDPDPPNTLTLLWKRVADNLQEHGVKVSTTFIINRVKEFGIEVRTKPATQGLAKEATPGSGKVKPIPTHMVTVDVSEFVRRGLTIRTLSDILTSPLRDDETNTALMGAIAHIREGEGLPALSLQEFGRIKKAALDRDASEG